MSKLPSLDRCVCGHDSHDHRDPNRWPQTACQQCECDCFETADEVNADLAAGTVVDLAGDQVRRRRLVAEGGSGAGGCGRRKRVVLVERAGPQRCGPCAVLHSSGTEVIE